MKKYLGDGVYIEYDGFGMRLTTEDGLDTTNEIYIEPTVWKALLVYVEKLQTEMQKP